MRQVTALLAVLAIAAGCNDYPVHRLLDSFEARVTTTLKHDQPIKLDFIWMIDDSPSMCGHQVGLAKGFGTFIDKLKQAGQIDAQMAVVSVQQIADIDTSSPIFIDRIGRFVNRPAQKFPPNCIESFKAPCASDAQCAKGFEYTLKSDKTVTSQSQLCTPNGSDKLKVAGGKCVSGGNDPNCQWRCKQSGTSAQAVNDNCSINSKCFRHCVTDQECRDTFEANVPPAQQTMKCFHPGGTPGENSGCQFPPPTSECGALLEKWWAQHPNDPWVLAHSKATCGNGECEQGETDGNCKVDCPLQNQVGAKPFPRVVRNDAVKPGDVSSLDLFKCVATVGASQTQESKFEGGFRSIWTALDVTRKKDAKGAWIDPPNCPYNAKDKPCEVSDVGKDPKCKAACQNKHLVRDDAYLVIVAVSDDDDCSVNLSIPLDQSTPELKASLKKILPTEVWDRCQAFGDAIGGNRWLNEGNCEYLKGKTIGGKVAVTKCPADCRVLASKGASGEEVNACWKEAQAAWATYAKVDWRFSPVNEYVNRFRSLKSDPAKVIFASVTGFSMASPVKNTKGEVVTYAQATNDRVADNSYSDAVAFYRAQIKNIAPGQAPMICQGKRGEAGFGTRYVQMAQAFGDNGVALNICGGEDFGVALSGIADKILKKVVKVCLPAPPDYDPKTGKPLIKVTLNRREGGKLISSKQLDYRPDCNGSKGEYCIGDASDCNEGKEIASQSAGQAACRTSRECGTGLVCLDHDPQTGIGACKVFSKAIYFPEVLEPTEEVDVNYHADLGL
jgi:hypothetical protein